MAQALLWAGSGTGFTFFMTALGAAMVFLFRRTVSPNLHRIMLGFAAGVMIAASMWSLLIPAIEEAQALGLPGWLPAAGGSALGILFLVAMDGLLPHLSPELLPAAGALALGIGIQNFPEGAAISLPLRQAGLSRAKSFLIGAASGAVEPIAALLTVLAAGSVQQALPWLLSFAAGAMLYVVVEELIPEANLRHDHQTHGGTYGVMVGFLLMMILDVALG